MNFIISNNNYCFDSFEEYYAIQISHNVTFRFLDDSILRYEKSKLNRLSFCLGTPLYEGVPFDDILGTVSAEFFNDNLDISNLKGNFLFVFIKDEEITILSDRGRQHQLFYNKITGAVSNSLQLLVESNRNKYKLNKMALYERIAIGFNLGEDTIFENIIAITPKNKEILRRLNIHYLNQGIVNANKLVFHDSGKADSLNRQISVLSDYFKLIDQTFPMKSGDLGLSGGFDCRLLLALASQNLTQKLHLHTHATAGVHEGQGGYAEKLAQVYGAGVTKVETSSPLDLSDEELEQMLYKNMVFFDGRSARHLGAYSQTYTADYKSASMGHGYYSLNGLGGEIYRDSYFTGNKKMTWNEWASRYLFLELSYEILPKDILHDLSAYLKKKILEELPWDKSYFDMVFTHSYYGLLKMPQCNGNLVAAYNKVSPILLPFVEPDNVVEALKAIPYFGIGGQYQAKMIKMISPDLAAVPTNYGGSFASLSWKYLIWSKMKTMGSANRRQALVTKKLLSKAQSASFQRTLESIIQRPILKSSLAKLADLVPGLNVNLALVDSTQRRNLIFLSYLLHHNSNKITL